MNEETKKLLFGLMHSHSLLCQAEYDRNPSMNNSHPAMKVEDEAINFMSKEGITEEYIAFVRSKED